jgi:hypothetical protein
MRTSLPDDSAPDWLVAEMPPGYQTRAAEIQRLEDELWQMGRFGRLLWRLGDELAEAVRDTFNAFGFEVELPRASAPALVTVKMDVHRRLLLHVSATDGIIQKRGPELLQVFRVLHEIAEDGDRVVLVTNATPSARPADRPPPMTPEALTLLHRLGTNILTGPTLFAIWTLWLQDHTRAHNWVERLHEQDGGMFVLLTLRTLLGPETV